MKLIVFCASILLTVTNSIAQVLGPPIVDLQYHFRPGSILHYHRHDETRNPSQGPGYENGNYDINEEIFLTVESVSSDGTATLLVENQESHDMRGGSNTSEAFGSSAHLAADIPKYRVTINPFGKVLHSEVLKRTPEDSAFLAEMKKASFNGSRRPDSSIIQLELARLLEVRPNKSGLHDASTWHDSLYKPKHVTSYPGTATAMGSAPQHPPPVSYDAIAYDYSIAQSSQDRKDSVFHLLDHEAKTEALGPMTFHWVTDKDQVCRTSDGLVLQKTTTYHRIVDRGLEQPYTKQTIKLISIK